MEEISLIIVDMDGTIYAMEDLVEYGFNSTVDYLVNYYHYQKKDAEEFLINNHIYPYVAKDAKSTTKLFVSMGMDIEHWDNYRSNIFGASLIKVENAINSQLLQELRNKATVVLLTNNTKRNVLRVLERLNIKESEFDEIVCNEANRKSISKKELMENIINSYQVDAINVLSIGDRFEVDGAPMVELGGHAIIIKKPRNIKKVIEDFNNFNTCDEYTYY